MLKSSFEFEVLVNGHSAKEYYHDGSYYIEGKEGSRFSLRMCNNSNHRVLFVPTIDGLSIMNGKEASFKSRGYIVKAYDALTIDGWRTSDAKVSEFFFSSPKDSYAKKMDRGNNLGVIGCVVFKEKEKIQVIEKVIKEYIPYPVYPNTIPFNPINPNHPLQWTLYNSSGLSGGGGAGTSRKASYSSEASSVNYSSASGSGSAPKLFTVSSELGTGFGQDKYSPVVTVEFDKESSPTETFSIYYNTRTALESMGVEFRKAIYVTPSAFPNEDGYCERP